MDRWQQWLTESLPGYEIGARLGAGGAGAVYAGTHRLLARDVAIKVVDLRSGDGDEAQLSDRFLREARVLASMRHPHVVEVYESLVAGSDGLLVMERCHGSVAELATTGAQPGDIELAGLIALSVLAGLDRVHRDGTVHRDIKPANVLIGANGSFKVADFGIAKEQDATQLTGVGGVIGTVAYMSPEQCEAVRDLTPASDLYGVGVMTYELMVGGRLFPGVDSTLELLDHQVNVQPQPLLERAEAPAAVAEVISRALSKDPAQRHGSARQFAEELAGAITAARGPNWIHRSDHRLFWPEVTRFADQPDSAANAPTIEPPTRVHPPQQVAPATLLPPSAAPASVRRNRMAIAAAAVLVAVAVAVGLFFLNRDGSSPPDVTVGEPTPSVDGPAASEPPPDDPAPPPASIAAPTPPSDGPTTPETAVPEPEIPEPDLPAPEIPEPQIPDPDLPEPGGEGAEPNAAEQIALVAGDVLAAQVNVALQVEPVQFSVGTAEILPESVPNLDAAALLLQSVPPGVGFEVGGHTDTAGSDAANQTLSQDRAEAVRDHFIANGVSADLLTAVGYGESDLKVDPETTPEDAAANRRIELRAIFIG